MDGIKQVYEETKNTINDRISSPMYGTFIVAWLAVNWKVWYVTFFVSEEILKINKIDYIIDLYNTGIWYDLWRVKLFLFPIASIFVVHWGLSRFDCEIYDKSLVSKYKKKGSKVDEEKKLEKKKLAKLEIEKAQDKLLTEEEKWHEEYANLRQEDGFNKAMSELYDSIYNHNGRKQDSKFTGDNLALLHTSKVSNIDFQSGKVSLTDKGKYFMNLYLNDDEDE